jgi:hypothetical protein
MNITPPDWAEALLRICLRPDEVDAVSGDLLEEYRDRVRPKYGQHRADRWYTIQVLGFVWRGTRLWAALFGAAFVVRTALDWFAPVQQFETRSAVSTALGVAILLAAGSWSAWRSGSVAAGTMVGVATTALGAVVSISAVVALLAIWHDPETMAAIRESGGLSEALTLPVMMVLPGIALGTMGGVVGATVKRLQSA